MSLSSPPGAAPVVWASIVTYNPDLAVLERLLTTLAPQVARVCVVDNASANAGDVEALAAGGDFLPQDENIGVAAGHNVAVRLALYAGADYVLTLDQDSLPAPDMVAKLVAAAEELAAGGKAVAAVGPVFHDQRYGYAPFVRLEGWRIGKASCPGRTAQPGAARVDGADEDGGKDLIAADYLITSGSLIPRQAWQEVGLLDEGLFIDYVDIEWGLRAKAKGRQCYGICSALLLHDLGDDAHTILGGRKIVPIHSPLRHYYLLRNGVLLLRRPEPPWRWKLNDAYRLLLKYGYYSLFATPRLLHFRMMSAGIWHGLTGRNGRFPA